MKRITKKMTQINPYLTFNGNCREAMEYYKECLGGELSFQTIGASPLSEKMPTHMKEFILHAALVKSNILLMGTDLVGENGLSHGNAVSLCLSCGSVLEIQSYYEKLSRHGIAEHRLATSFWGVLCGDLTDKFGKHWLLTM